MRVEFRCCSALPYSPCISYPCQDGDGPPAASSHAGRKKAYDLFAIQLHTVDPLTLRFCVGGVGFEFSACTLCCRCRGARKAPFPTLESGAALRPSGCADVVRNTRYRTDFKSLSTTTIGKRIHIQMICFREKLSTRQQFQRRHLRHGHFFCSRVVQLLETGPWGVWYLVQHISRNFLAARRIANNTTLVSWCTNRLCRATLFSKFC